MLNPFSQSALALAPQARSTTSTKARLLASLCAFSTLAALTGCSSFQTTAAAPAGHGQALSGNLHGGQQPIYGAHIYLYSTGTSGYASASVSLLNAGAPGVTLDAFQHGYVTSDANGNFSITGDYTCAPGLTQATALPNPETFIYATGGNPGLADPSTNNTAIELLAAVGPCGNLTPATFINVSEVSTVAAITALHQFMTGDVNIGAPAANSAGIANAFTSIQNLLDVGSSTPRQTNLLGNGAAPYATINTLADILATCVNSASPSSSPCSKLFNAAAPPGGSHPTTVSQAMYDIARYPANNTSALFGLIGTSTPFEPTLTSAPASYTLAFTYTGSGLNAPGVITIDGSGNAWSINCPNCISAGNPSGTDAIVGIGAQGATLSGPNGYTAGIHMPQGLAIDQSGNLWTTNLATGDSTPDNVMQMTAQGAPVAGFPVSNSSINTPEGIAIDSIGNAWVSNFNRTSPGSAGEVKLSSTGAILVPTVNSPGFSGSLGIGIDNSGNIYAAGTYSNSILKLDTNGAVLSGSGAGYTGGGTLSAPLDIALDSGPHVWTYNNATNGVGEIFGNGGSTLSPAGGYLAGFAQAALISIDGVGTAWIPNCRKSCPGSGDSTDADDLVHLDTTGAVVTGASGYQDKGFSAAGGSAIDASGNLWVTSNIGNSLTELLGIASPVDTPLAAQVENATVGLRAGSASQSLPGNSISR